MDALTVGVVAAAVAVVVGFLLGRKTGRTPGGGIGGAAARSTASGETTEADAAFRLALSRIGAYLRDNVDGPLAAAFQDRSLSLRRAAEDAVAAIDDLHFFFGRSGGGRSGRTILPESSRTLSRLTNRNGTSPYFFRLRARFRSV